jgi:hypothetical protein
LTLVPNRYFYLVDVEREELLAIHPADGLTELQVTMLEQRLRAEQHVDDPDSGLALRDSAVRPLPLEALARVFDR